MKKLMLSPATAAISIILTVATLVVLFVPASMLA